MKATVLKKQLHFKRPAGTSRGVYTERQVWYVVLTDEHDPHHRGIGECAPLPRLSSDDLPHYEDILRRACRALEADGRIDHEALRPYPSIRFGLETALRHYETRSFRLWQTPFAEGKQGIPINGLIWMGNYEEMHRRIEEKMAQGFRCIKLKIGAIDFERELALLAHIRRRFSPRDIELRVDANGAFSPHEAADKLKRLSRYGLHSIEQPIRAGQWQAMAKLCADTPLPIALDEELIGIDTLEAKRELLDTIRPQYIILKPSLHGGIGGSEEWIKEARERNIGWWITSALESNIGLNAIAQWTASLNPALPQGLGTGMLFTDNVDLPLHIEGDRLFYRPEADTSDTIGGLLAQDEYLQDLDAFRREWEDDSPTVEVHTSGSTGAPKAMRVEKARMRASARLTCRFLGLKEGDTALLCMPMRYIAGKMMAVRAQVAGLRPIPVAPCGRPLKHLNEAPHFAAMTPMQVYNSLQVPAEKEKLMRIRRLIIGGGAIDAALEKALQDFPHPVWSTYGMTETLSHIALRRINGPEAADCYTPLEGVSVRLSEEGTLIIRAPEVCAEELTTNDLAKTDADGRFRILGRKDNIINSGGVKIPIEQVEAVLKEHLDVPFQITAAPDAKFGEAVAMIYEGTPDRAEALRRLCKDVLPPYRVPKHYRAVEALPLTGTGKPDRAEARRLFAAPPR